MFDAVVVCARFQPPHRGHFAALDTARIHAPRVLALVQGADAACSLKNPWSSAERVAMLLRGLQPGHGVTPVLLRDIPYDAGRWIARAEAAVAAALGGPARIAVLADAAPGRAPIATTWTALESCFDFAAGESELRDALLLSAMAPAWPRVETAVPAALAADLHRWSAGADSQRLRAEAAFIRAFKHGWADAPYPPVFVTVDALVTWHRRVLLIRRERMPGKDLWALPGGFIEQGETLAAACVRELQEETGLMLQEHAIREHRVFDDPARSLRGRTIAHVFRFALEDAREPALAAGDDAAAATWQDLATLSPTQFFEDHYAILQAMLGLE